MAEPTNTPLPTAPGTPISATPRSASPTQHLHHHFFQHPPIPNHLIINSSRNTSVDHGNPAGLDSIIASNAVPTTDGKPAVLVLSDEGQHDSNTPSPFGETCQVLRPSIDERSRGLFTAALRERRWGDFFAIVQPVSSSNEPGDWDEELISLLPSSVKVFVSARGASARVDTLKLKERGISYVTFEELTMRMIVDVHAATKGF